MRCFRDSRQLHTRRRYSGEFPAAHLKGAEEGEDVGYRGLAALGMHSTATQHSVLLQRAKLRPVHDLHSDVPSRQNIFCLYACAFQRGRRGKESGELFPIYPWQEGDKTSAKPRNGVQ